MNYYRGWYVDRHVVVYIYGVGLGYWYLHWSRDVNWGVYWYWNGSGDRHGDRSGNRDWYGPLYAHGIRLRYRYCYVLGHRHGVRLSYSNVVRSSYRYLNRLGYCNWVWSRNFHGIWFFYSDWIWVWYGDLYVLGYLVGLWYRVGDCSDQCAFCNRGLHNSGPVTYLVVSGTIT